MGDKRPQQNGKSAHRSLVQSKIRVKFGNDEQLESWRCADGLKAGDDLRNKLGLERLLEIELQRRRTVEGNSCQSYLGARTMDAAAFFGDLRS